MAEARHPVHRHRFLRPVPRPRPQRLAHHHRANPNQRRSLATATHRCKNRRPPRPVEELRRRGRHHLSRLQKIPHRHQNHSRRRSAATPVSRKTVVSINKKAPPLPKEPRNHPLKLEREPSRQLNTPWSAATKKWVADAHVASRGNRITTTGASNLATINYVEPARPCIRDECREE